VDENRISNDSRPKIIKYVVLLGGFFKNYSFSTKDEAKPVPACSTDFSGELKEELSN
jgi:hypothetical protein